MKTVADVMTRDVRSMSPSDTVSQAAQAMSELDVGVIPVCDGAKLVGVVTDRDIVCRVVAVGRNPTAATARDAMTEPVVSVSLDSSLDAVMGKMEQHQIRRVLVVDADGACCGIIAQADVARKAEEQDTGELVRAVSR